MEVLLYTGENDFSAAIDMAIRKNARIITANTDHLSELTRWIQEQPARGSRIPYKSPITISEFAQRGDQDYGNDFILLDLPRILRVWFGFEDWETISGILIGAQDE